MGKRRLTPDQVAGMLRVAAGMVRYEIPDAHLVRERVAELAAMGFRDEPTVEGVASSVRQYAWATLNAKGPPTAFGTHDAALLARAAELAARFGVMPIPAPRTREGFRVLAGLARLEIPDEVWSQPPKGGPTP